MKRALLLLSLALAALLGIVLARTALLRSRQVDVTAAAASFAPPDPDGALRRLSEGIRIPTISQLDPAQVDGAAFEALHRHLAASYPMAHARLAREVVNGLSLVYTWPGRDPAKPPVLLMAHLDVVPVLPGTEGDWEQPPFSGAIADGFIWGRGAIDVKSKVYALLEATESLVGQGFQPERTVYLSFGGDEEVGGGRGAVAIAERFRAQGVRFAYVLDEGGVIGDRLVPGVAAPVAMVGIAEKGYLSLELSVTQPGGHSSIPPPQTGVGILAAAIARLEAEPMPAAIRGPTRAFLETLAPAMSPGRRLAIANLWLFEPVVVSALSATPRGDASVRTTTAPTMFEGSTKDNVLPIRSRAVVNFRILPGDTVASVTEHVRRVANDTRVVVQPLPGLAPSDPSPVSRIDSPAWRLLERTIRESDPRILVAPQLVLGATDARHFADLSDSVYRFGPIWIGPDDLTRAHGTNERIDAKRYLESIGFYVRLLQGTLGTE